MRGLTGDFSTMPLKDLVVYLGTKRATGLLTVDHEEQRKQVVIREGFVVNASSNEPREYLGQFLINLGQITEEQFNKAYETQKETKIFLGKILVMIGAVSEEAIKSALSLKLRETLLQAFNWTDGTFSFEADLCPELPEGMELQVDLMDVHREGEFRETAWQAIRAVFPSGEARLSLDEGKLPEPPRPGSLDERIFKLVRAGNSIDEIVLALHATDFFLYQRLYALYRLDAVKVADPRASPSFETDEDLEEVAIEADEPMVGEETNLADMLAHAEMFLAQGNYTDAEPLARRAFELGPNGETEALLRRAESGLAADLRKRLMDGKPVAVLLVPPAKLKTLQLTAPERYLLSRVDGTRDVPSIIQVSPLHELEAMKLFHRFVEQGLVKIG